MPPDDLTQQPIAECSGGETPAKKQPDDKSSPGQEQEVPPTNGNNRGHPEPFRRSVIIFAALETLGGVVAVIASDLTGYFKFILHWIGLCCNAAGFFAVWHEATEKVETKIQRWRIWKFGFSSACVICLVIAWLVWWPKVNSAFSVVAHDKYVELKTPRNLLLWNSGGERTLSPIHVEIFADLIIKKDKHMTIDSYQFEGKTPRNEWVIMPVIDLSLGQLIWLTATNGDHTKRAMRKHIGTNDFYSVLKNRRIAPNDPIPVYIYLEAPTNWLAGEIRLRLKDIEGDEYTETISGPASPKSIFENIPISFSIGMSAEPEDLSKLPIVRYSSVIFPDNWWNSPN